MRPYVNNEYIICDNITYINIQYKNQIVQTIIDTNIIEKVSKYNWRITIKRNKMYVVSGQNRNGTLIYLHDICNLCPIVIKGYDTDHINGNSLDNRHENLRYVPHQINVDNTSVKCTNKLGIRGISFDPRYNVFTVDYSFHKQRFYIKPWKTLEEAIYCRYCLEKYFGQSILLRNINASKYLESLPKSTQLYIESYVLNKISGN